MRIVNKIEKDEKKIVDCPMTTVDVALIYTIFMWLLVYIIFFFVFCFVLFCLNLNESTTFM